MLQDMMQEKDEEAKLKEEELQELRKLYEEKENYSEDDMTQQKMRRLSK